MAHILQGLWERAQGKWHVKKICNKVFDEYCDPEKKFLELSNLHLATLLVYNSVNKQLLSPHKEPPSRKEIAEKIKSKGIGEVDREQFYQLILEWIRKDLHIVLANRIVLALLAAPSLAIITRNAGRKVPGVRNVVEKVPAPLFFSAYSIGLLLLQDIRVD